MNLISSHDKITDRFYHNSCLITSNDLVEDQWYDKDFDKCQDDLANEYRNLGGTPNPKLIEDIEQCCKAWVYGEEKTEMSEQSRRLFEYFKESGVLRRALCECYMRYHHGHVEDVCFKGNPAALIEVCTQNHSIDFPPHFILISEESSRKRVADLIERHFSAILKNHSNLVNQFPYNHQGKPEFDSKRRMIEWEYVAEPKASFDSKRLILLFSMHVLRFRFEGLDRSDCHFTFLKLDELGPEEDIVENIIPLGITLKARDPFNCFIAYAKQKSLSLRYASRYRNAIGIDRSGLQEHLFRFEISQFVRNYADQREFQLCSSGFPCDLREPHDNETEDVFLWFNDDSDLVDTNDGEIVKQDMKACALSVVNKKLTNDYFWTWDRTINASKSFYSSKVEFIARGTSIPKCKKFKCRLFTRNKQKCYSFDQRCDQCKGYPDGFPKELKIQIEGKSTRCYVAVFKGDFGESDKIEERTDFSCWTEEGWYLEQEAQIPIVWS